MRTMLLALTGCLLILSGSRACAGPAGTSEYVFVADQSTILQTGGFAGVHWTYHIEGRFRLTVNADAGTASFSCVEAYAVDDSSYKRTLDPNDVFNLAALTGKVVDETSIRFEGKVGDGSSVLITLTFVESTVTLKGGTTPPPHSADFFVFTLDAVAQRRYACGTGEPNDPYQIATAADLIALGETPEDYGKHFILTADIDLDPNLPGRKVFDKAVIAPPISLPMGYFGGPAFTGVFDGAGHTVSHLTIRGEDYVGLFGYLGSGAEVNNLGVVDANVTGSGADGGVGGLVGLNFGDVTCCNSTGGINGGYSVGGLVGSNGGTVAYCYSASAVNGVLGVGGLVGHNGLSSVVGSVLPGIVVECYSTGPVSGNNYVGGLVGSEWISQVTRCFWDTETSGQAASAGGTGKTTTEMQTAKMFLDAGWDFVGEAANGTEDLWWILEGRDYPRLWWEQVLSDDFADGKAEPLWMLFQPEPEAVWLKEVNGRLEVQAVAQPEDVDAIYVANGWRLDATKDFALRVDFHFSKRGPGDGRVTLGVVPGLDPAGLQWAELEAGCSDTGPFFLYEVRDGFWVQERVTERSADNGTLYLSYNPDTDELYFSWTGYGKPNAWQTVPGLLKGRWASEAVYIILSGGSEGMALDPGDAWLDNFILNSGVPVPDASAQE